MTRKIIICLLSALTGGLNVYGQQSFSFEDYNAFRHSVAGLSAAQLQQMYARPAEAYYKGFESPPDVNGIGYLDSAIHKLSLTEGELTLLEQNRFFVTERMSYESFGTAFHNVYYYDLPVFISTDAVLHALHKSYDEVLLTLERKLMSSNLDVFLRSLYQNFHTLTAKYGTEKNLFQPLKDVALYVTVAYSLIRDSLMEGLPLDEVKLQEVWNGIRGEQMVGMQLFANHYRSIDFSQFKVRGHYVYTLKDQQRRNKSLEPYFRTMMWLGRIDFFLTPPPENPYEEPWSEEDILRMNLDAFLLQELFNNSANGDLFLQNEQIINHMVGKSDNIIPSQYQAILDSLGIRSAEQLLEDSVYEGCRAALTGNSGFAQKILSDFFIMDPGSDEPGILPVSYRLSGQRFILDSYILGNVVYDRIIVNGNKIMRMMPDPLDALFALGNNDVLPFLEEGLNQYHYSGQLASLRYLVDNKPESYWNESLYNVWLNSIRALNPVQNDDLPLFMQTAAWHQEKMNTQLASWSQLRHDNLLYAKQSYTGGTACSYPYSYVEPYPEFYKNVKQFANNAAQFFGEFNGSDYYLSQIEPYFRNFAEVTAKLENLAEKELAGESFTNEEIKWLQNMLFTGGMSGEPPFLGWYSDLFFDTWDATEHDYTVADIHTQPTDEYGNMVGKVLHAGVGKINLGIFIANRPGSQDPVAYVGPVMSYYQTVTDNFKRLTDQDWEEMVDSNLLPGRPDWTNIYLAGENGQVKSKGAELPSKLYVNTPVVVSMPDPVEITVYPNPFNGNFNVSIHLKEKNGVRFKLYNSAGVLIRQLGEAEFPGGLSNIHIDGNYLAPGMYFLKAGVEGVGDRVIKVIKK